VRTTIMTDLTLLPAELAELSVAQLAALSPPGNWSRPATGSSRSRPASTPRWSRPTATASATRAATAARTSASFTSPTAICA